MSNIVVFGSQWGDEGKGKIVDMLAQECAAIVRFRNTIDGVEPRVVARNAVPLFETIFGVPDLDRDGRRRRAKSKIDRLTIRTHTVFGWLFRQRTLT